MTTTTETTETTVTAVLDRMEQAWNGADGNRFASVFTGDADFVNIHGEHYVGELAIARGHQGIFDTIYAGSTNRFQLERARLVAPATIVAVIRSTLDSPAGPLQGVHHARFTLALVDEGSRWAVAAFHNTLEAPPR